MSITKDGYFGSEIGGCVQISGFAGQHLPLSSHALVLLTGERPGKPENRMRYG